MSEKGSLYGARLAREVVLGQVPIRSAMSLAYGKLRYNGGVDLEDGGYLPLRLTTENWLIDMRATASWVIRPVEHRAAWRPYGGFGYRLLVDDLPTIWGYTREQTYWFLPVGVEAEMRTGGGHAWVLGGEYDWFLRGYNVSGGDTFTQDRGSGFRVRLSVDVPLDDEETGHLRTETFVQGWRVAESTTSEDGYYEPANKSTLYGVSVSMLF